MSSASSSPSPPDPGVLVGRVLGGRYRVVRVIGEGGMGAVYAAVQEDLQRRVALKVLHGDLSPEDVQRFRQEALSAAELGHPNIVQVTDFQHRPGEPPFLVMEALEGESLRDLRAREPVLPEGRAVFIAVQILAALSAAHAARIIHRDIKPANVFLSRTPAMDDLVKLLDFGIAKVLRAGASGPRTDDGSILGTPSYMAPEQVLGLAIDERTDLHAVGVVLFELLSGSRPYLGDTSGEVMMAIARHAPLRLADVAPQIEPRLAAVVDRAVAKDPEGRPRSALAMIEELSPWSRGVSSVVARGSGGSREASAAEMRTRTGTAVVAPTLREASRDVGRGGGQPLSSTVPPTRSMSSVSGSAPVGHASSLAPTHAPFKRIGAPAWAIVLTIGTVLGSVVGGIALFGYFATRKLATVPALASGGGGGGMEPGRNDRFQWDDDAAPAAAQLVGDATEDFVGGGSEWANYPTGWGTETFVAVFDGATFRRAWRTPNLGGPGFGWGDDLHFTALASRVVVATDRTLTVYEGASGRVLSTATAVARVKSLCVPTGSKTEVWMELARPSKGPDLAPGSVLDVVTGKLRTATVLPAGCGYRELERRMHSGAGENCNRSVVCNDPDVGRDVDGEALAEGSLAVAIEETAREDDRRLVGVDLRTKRVRWSRPAPPTHKLVDLASGRAYVQEMSPDSRSMSLDAIDLATGAVVWTYHDADRGALKLRDVKLLRASSARVYLLQHDHVTVVDLANGKELARIGKE